MYLLIKKLFAKKAYDKTSIFLLICLSSCPLESVVIMKKYSLSENLFITPAIILVFPVPVGDEKFIYLFQHIFSFFIRFISSISYLS